MGQTNSRSHPIRDEDKLDVKVITRVLHRTHLGSGNVLFFFVSVHFLLYPRQRKWVNNTPSQRCSQPQGTKSVKILCEVSETQLEYQTFDVPRKLFFHQHPGVETTMRERERERERERGS